MLPPTVCVIADGTMADTALAALIHAAADAGVDMIQLRARHLEGRALIERTRRANRLAAGTETRIVVNERVDVALAAESAGVHLRGDSFSAVRVRAAAPRPFLIGRSVHSEEEAVDADDGGDCDYLVFGSVFPSTSKSEGHRPAGVAALRRVCERVRTPVIAIGGITLANARLVRDAGAAGVAAISLFRDCADLRGTIGALTRAFAR